MAVSAYRAALCEDEPQDRAQLTGLCQEIFDAWGVEAELVPFPSADALRRELDGGGAPFDLYLLDIQMAGTTGLELARQLYRQGVRDRVILITGNPEYALESYDVHPLHYLLKPVGRERMETALGLALERQGPQTVLFQREGRTAALPIREIRCLESRDHGVAVRLGAETKFFPLSLTEAESRMPAGAFARCHKSYLVSLAWVEEFSRAEVLLRDGTRLPVSRTFYAPFQSALIHYLNRRA